MTTTKYDHPPLRTLTVEEIREVVSEAGLHAHDAIAGGTLSFQITGLPNGRLALLTARDEPFSPRWGPDGDPSNNWVDVTDGFSISTYASEEAYAYGDEEQVVNPDGSTACCRSYDTLADLRLALSDLTNPGWPTYTAAQLIARLRLLDPRRPVIATTADYYGNIELFDDGEEEATAAVIVVSDDYDSRQW